MTTFLKGDTTAEMTLALAEGFDYSGKTVCLEYQGVKRSFSSVAAGGVLAFSFTARETAPMSLGAYPVRVWIEGADGATTTIHNADVKLRVTDCIADVHGGGAIYLDVRGGLHGIEGLPDRFTDEDLRNKVNEIVRRLGGAVAMAALALLPVCGSTVEVHTAPKGVIYNDQQIVTNVTVDVSDKADKADVYTKAETDALIQAAAPEPDYTAANETLVATIKATAPATDLSPATNYTDAVAATLRAKSDLAYRNEIHNGIEKWTVQIQGVDAPQTAEWNDDFQQWYNLNPPVNGLGIKIAASGYILSTTGGEFPFTLSGGSATVGDGWFTYTLTPVMYPDDRLALVSEIGGSGGPTNVEEQIAAATNAVAAAAKNYTDEQIAKISGGGEWNRPGEWTLAFDAIPTTPTIQEVSFTTNVETGVIISNVTVQVSESLSAHVFPIVLDELSQSSPPTVTLSCDDATTTIDGSVFTATEDGVYTVRGVASNGVARSAQVAIYSSHTTRRTTRAYVADTNGLRQDLNNYTREVLTSASDNGTLDYIEDVGPGSFRSWGTITPAWAWPGRGRDSPWAIAPKVLVSASHWGWYWPTGEVTLPDIVGGTNFTIKISSREYWPNLVEWARANGYTVAKTAIADMVDIRLGVIEEGYIPDACLPYLVDTEELDALFGGSLEGVTAWFYPQGDSITREGNHYPYCIPVALLPSDYNTERIRWTGAALLTDSYATTVRADVLSAIGTYDARNWYRIRPGDSGRPCFIRWDIFDIVISQAHTVGTGPSFPAAAKIIRAFCAAHGCAPKTLPR